MKAFYDHEPGYCLSATIDKYVYVMVNSTKHQGIRSIYDVVHDAEHIDEVKSSIIKECLKSYGISTEVTVASVSDIPVHGSGLGSSSAFTVGLLNALKGYHESNSSWDLAEEACNIEIHRCHHPIGKQDQYATAIGGVNLWTFKKDEIVDRRSTLALQQNVHDLIRNMVLLYSGMPRQANDILKAQNKAIEDVDRRTLLAANGARALVGLHLIEQGKFNDFGKLLHDAWRDKKKIVEGISNPEVDAIYDKALYNGAIGGKLIGAGGGGFFLFYVPLGNLARFRIAMNAYKMYDFNVVEHGSRIFSLK